VEDLEMHDITPVPPKARNMEVLPPLKIEQWQGEPVTREDLVHFRQLPPLIGLVINCSGAGEYFRIDNVKAGSPGHAVGLQCGDEIDQVIGVSTSLISLPSFAKVLTQCRPGDLIPISVIRAGKSITKEVRVGTKDEAYPVSRVYALEALITKEEDEKRTQVLFKCFKTQQTQPLELPKVYEKFFRSCWPR
jgi:predicted metalloprotease with PDZ domain